MTNPSPFERVASGKYLYSDKERRSEDAASKFCDSLDSTVASLDQESDILHMINVTEDIPKTMTGTCGKCDASTDEVSVPLFLKIAVAKG